MPPEDRITFASTGEVRFAVVLYGGVSLAIYMNGIAQELYSLVRATAPEPDGGSDDDGSARELHVTDLDGAEATYRELACRLDGNELLPGNDSVVKTRFVVDILTGTSAGGINGVFLAKALVNDQRIQRLTDLWINEGDIAELLNDANAYATLGNLPKERPPESLLSGQFMLFKLLDALDGVSVSNAAAEKSPDTYRSPYADQIDLWVTATDLNGRPEKIALEDQARLGSEREVDHHTRFHFVYDANDIDDAINMFGRPYDPLLALAARATSSFPAAFRPVQPKDIKPVRDAYLSTRPVNDRTRDWLDLASPQAQRVFQRYGKPEYYETVSFADGGYLDNQPVDLVMQTLPKRSADLPVRRRVLLIDPDPGNDPPKHVEKDAPRVDLLSTLLKVVTLPRVETIGAEVDRIEALAGPLAIRKAVYAAIQANLETEGTADDAGASSDSPSHHGYLVLRVGNTIDDLAVAIARVGFTKQAYEPDTAEYRLVQRVVAEWYASTPLPAFLDRLDLAFLMRRINFVKHQLGGDRRGAKQQLDVIYQRMIRNGRALRSRTNDTPGIAALRTALDQLRTVSKDPNSTASDRETARANAVRDLEPVLNAFADRLALTHEHDAATAIIEGLHDESITLRWDNFDAFDEATLALRQFIPGENDDIGVVRVSPRDAQSIYAETTGRPKLAGAAVHHFGGFFSADWRRSDIMWGRLDAAERLITVVFESSNEADNSDEARAATREYFIKKAQLGIITELLRDKEYIRLFKIIAPGCDEPAGSGPKQAIPAPENVLTCLRAYRPAPGPTREEVLTLATRASRVTDAMLGGLADVPGPLVKLRKWISAALRPAAQLGELVVDRSIKSAVTRHLLDLGILAAILMIVVSPLVGAGTVTGFGWSVLAIAVAAKLLINIARNWVRHRRWWWIAGAVVGALLALLGVEGLLLSKGATRWAGLFLLGAACGLLVAAHNQTAKQQTAKQQTAKQQTAKQQTAKQQKHAPLPKSVPVDTSRGKPVVALTLAIALVVTCAGIGVNELRSDATAKLCRQSRWEHNAINWLPGIDCPAGS